MMDQNQLQYNTINCQLMLSILKTTANITFCKKTSTTTKPLPKPPTESMERNANISKKTQIRYLCNLSENIQQQYIQERR